MVALDHIKQTRVKDNHDSTTTDDSTPPHIPSLIHLLMDVEPHPKANNSSVNATLKYQAVDDNSGDSQRHHVMKSRAQESLTRAKRHCIDDTVPTSFSDDDESLNSNPEVKVMMHAPPSCPPPVPAITKEEDPFLYYSNDKIRLEYLLGKELFQMVPTEGPVKRKKRISFELDPFFSLVNSS
mmetsp:Transcript_19387/g.29456  ORF Transcript_19387/g.29456 Transcript_19387/m.29456 type:complete len:182 (-) Transcript_19387:418-963(-)|eukprot:CAMPEP_0196141916 /NCGR_PEP_ID=MMETSP0910-20130528/10708_1 /TAXON_ID=49265 /ORGANISM="Thalassiosira rotula, Strain GSO102" /LENGTH=181 /DNA_ID=CAMNT_0041403149 /DNA_START=195 /DNA_END=740 /DNA_ORIENTATION=-